MPGFGPSAEFATGASVSKAPIARIDATRLNLRIIE
jgi:hypothetical protein